MSEQTMYSGIKNSSLATATDVQAPVLTSETTSSTATDTTISQNDTDVNSSIHEKGGNNTKFSLPETDSDAENFEVVYGFKIKQGIEVNEDLLELLSIYDKNAKVDTNGNVTVYHRTTADAAEKIQQTGIMTAKEDALFFSSEENGYASDYGDIVITLKIPSTVLEVNDVFDGEVHFDLPLRYKNGVYGLNVSRYLKDTGEKFSIAEDMSEQERYDELKDKSIALSYPNMDKIAEIDLDSYRTLRTREAKKPIRKIADMLGIHNVNYKNSSIDFDFAFSKSNLDISVNHQQEYGGDYSDYAKMLTCINNLIENAELIEVHKNYKVNEYLKRTHVLISAFSDGGLFRPFNLRLKNTIKDRTMLFI